VQILFILTLQQISEKNEEDHTEILAGIVGI